MRDNNKRKREEETYYIPNVTEYQEGTNSATISHSSVEHGTSFNQPLLLNQQPVVQNHQQQQQQMLYQLQRASDQQQNLVYLLVPANDNIQLQSVPLNLLPPDHSSSDQIDSILPHDDVKPELPIVKAEYYEENKNITYSLNTVQKACTPVYTLPKPAATGGKDQVKSTGPHLYRCDYKDCSANFYSLYEKKLHLDSHYFPESNEFKCSICNMVFEKALDRNKHVESHAIAPTFKCRHCQEEFAYYTVLLKHIEEKKCSLKNPLVCYFCELKFYDTEDFVRHHQLAMKQCMCGSKICGTQAYEMHLSVCVLSPTFKVMENTNVNKPPEKKKIKIFKMKKM